jgi:two-component system, cell cycle sensor histidine kinase DivJ
MSISVPTLFGKTGGSQTGQQHGEAQLYRPLFWLGGVCTAVTVGLVLPLSGGQSWPLLVVTALLACFGMAAAHLLFNRAGKAKLGSMVSVACSMLVLAWAAALSGGINSALAIFFVLAPMEARLTRRTECAFLVGLMGGVAFALSALAAPLLGQGTGISEQVQLMLHTAALLYALSLAARLVGLSNLKDIRAQATQRAIDQFHAVTNDVFAILAADGRVHQVFGAVHSVLGAQGSDLQGDGLLQRVHVADRPALLTSLYDVHAHQGRASLAVRVRTGAIDGPQMFQWTEMDLSAMAADEGQGSVYLLIRDISAAKQHESELMLAREKAESSDAAKGRFLATMSHELRTPLNAIIGFADLLEEEVFGPLANPQQREYVGLIRESGGHLLHLVNDLLDMSKLEAGHFQIVIEPFAMSQVVQRCAKLVGAQIQKAGQTLNLDLVDGLPEIIADQRAVRQIVINLLSNASKFTPRGGTICVKVRRDGAMLALSVIDSGIGISSDDMKKLGQPFFQADGAYSRNHQGTGLGLSVVKGLAELHDGSMGFSSVLGEGTTVTIRLPLAGPRQHQPLEAGAVQEANTVVLSKLLAARHAVGRAAAAEKAAPAGLPIGEQAEAKVAAHG